MEGGGRVGDGEIWRLGPKLGECQWFLQDTHALTSCGRRKGGGLNFFFLLFKKKKKDKEV